MEPEKPCERDFTAETDAALQAATVAATAAGAKNTQLVAAVEGLYPLEKQTRGASDVKSNTRILTAIVELCAQAKDWALLSENLALLSKKRGLLKSAVRDMIQAAMALLDPLAARKEDQATLLSLIDTLRTLTEGKIFVEVERARVTQRLSKLREAEGKTDEACAILLELQVETFGSMEKREKTDFILEQMRLCLLTRDYVRAQVSSRKINLKYFKEAGTDDLKLRYYRLMVALATQDGAWLDVCRHYSAMYDTPSVKADEAQWKAMLGHAVLYAALAPYDNEQSDTFHRLYADPKLAEIPLIQAFAKSFLTMELVRWPRVEQMYGAELRQTDVYARSSPGEARWSLLHKRVIEHNIRVVAKYYTSITLARLTQLLDLPPKETEAVLAELVVKGTLWARIDRPAGTITFVNSKAAGDLSTAWANDVNKLLELVVETTHLIAKEEMVHKITKVVA
ncbi:hypothetical protein CXG81DRAFT_9818 [Caulochytrium protostelioides]|uniref:PCI domain-containing protein n=1 Tax=Caulochytrium protostelioides TaxID=1555241 RepID=A0A4P9XCP2_9FUNG|nr:hypothetical protein CXG81DRAFT_9818 [Caulochytrium protostelioides]|eukprot:RKP03227.1 hypothetical protein CXG81DRAFT_9818 [Caulochytrium protostelioides]